MAMSAERHRRQPFMHEVDQQIGREAMRQHSRFGAAE
jgi:hypothetical protein